MKKYGYLYMAAALMLPQILPTYTYAEEVAPTVQLSFDERMDETMKALAPMFGIQSVQYAVLDAGELIASGDTANTTDTLYGIGSVSKVYTTMAVMQLVEQGKIDLDTPVVTYIPEFEMADARYKDITPRMLLNHSSGIMGTTFKNMLLLEDDDTYSTSHLLEALKTQWLKADPGAFSVYCNDG
ncbi:MAG: serine hydrolase domain-containing protein, partial [Cellulosilyticaceae bacterium]